MFNESAAERLDKIIAKMTMNDYPILSIVSCNLAKTELESIKTMGVRANGNKYGFAYNSDFVNSLEEVELYATVKHEFLHILMGHIYEKRTDLSNVAADLSISKFCFYMNNYFEGAKKNGDKISKTAIYVDSFTPALPESLSFEEYYALLQKKYPPNKISELSEKVGDSHDGWGSPALEKLKEIIGQEIRENAHNPKMWGDTPGELKDMILSVYNNEINWVGYLRSFMASAVSINRQSSRRVWNKKYGSDFPGKRRSKKSSILVALDVSGSMSDDDISYCLGSIDSLARNNGAEVTLAQFDAKIQCIGKNYRPADPMQLSGRGGTDPNCVMSFVRENRNLFDALCVFTDGAFGEVDQSNICKTLWVFTNGKFNDRVTGMKTSFSRPSNK